MSAVPRCPVTGEPATKLVQHVGVDLVRKLWLYAMKVDIGPLPPDLVHFGLWESRIGLRFFDPMIPGSQAFYRQFYRTVSAHEIFAGGSPARAEFIQAAARIPRGARVLDVGCGLGSFRRHVEHAAYTGLDPHFGGDDPSGTILAETLEEHAARNREGYDAVCAFQVLEHVADPLAFARTMAGCVRPGGLLVIGVPVWPSPLVEIPNFLINLVPHHLTWWSRPALTALAGALDLEPEAVEDVPCSRHDAVLWWIWKLSPVKCREIYFSHRLHWHASLLAGYVLGRLVGPLAPVPTGGAPVSMLLVARKRAAPG